MKNIIPQDITVCFVWLVLLSMVSCAPAVTIPYYRPVAAGGTVVNAHCPPVDSFVLFEEHDIIVGAHAAFSEEGRLSATITFEVPKGKTVRLLDQDLWVNIPSRGSSKVKLSGYIWTGAGRTSDFSPATPLIGETGKKLFLKQVTLYGTTNHAYYMFYATLDVSEPEPIMLKIPKFSVGDIVVELPEVKFEWSSKFFSVYPFNC